MKYLVLFLCAFSLAAEPIRGQWYEVASDGDIVDAALLLQELEARFAFCNRIFRFDDQNMPGLLKVRAFYDEEAYTQAVDSHRGESGPGAVYIHYWQADRRELIVHRGSPDEQNRLPYQAFIQYLRAFVQEPPAWIRDGFAGYLSSWQWTGCDQQLVHIDEWPWLESVKPVKRNESTWKDFLTADPAANPPPEFRNLGTAVITYLMEGGNDEYYRTLIECFMNLSVEDSAQGNTLATARRIARWTDPEQFENDFQAFLGKKQTFAEIFAEGQKAYTDKNLPGAEKLFKNAQEMQPDHYAPYYYLGLVAYDSANFAHAEQYFRKSLSYGLDFAMARYALGVNALGAGRVDEAEDLLKQAAQSNPENYQAKVEDILKRINRRP
ncbi:hypothetical protein FACS1894164_13190 [Spirochaetia bacterium]|nr:hypothetical protein FACS1894164_13190 [Spirochaetia bacterium]